MVALCTILTGTLLKVIFYTDTKTGDFSELYLNVWLVNNSALARFCRNLIIFFADNEHKLWKSFLNSFDLTANHTAETTVIRAIQPYPALHRGMGL